MADPIRFEDEYPDVAAFIMRVYAAGGKFKQPRDRMILLPKFPPVIDVARNSPCPCGSGKKTKRCHPYWAAKK